MHRVPGAWSRGDRTHGSALPPRVTGSPVSSTIPTAGSSCRISIARTSPRTPPSCRSRRTTSKAPAVKAVRVSSGEPTGTTCSTPVASSISASTNRTSGSSSTSNTRGGTVRTAEEVSAGTSDAPAWSRSVKRLPRPGRVDSWSSEPRSRARAATRANPTPRPGAFVLKPASKHRRRVSSSIPGPSSSTPTVIVPSSSRWTTRRISPSGCSPMASSALRTRFRSTSRRSPGRVDAGQVERGTSGRIRAPGQSARASSTRPCTTSRRSTVCICGSAVHPPRACSAPCRDLRAAARRTSPAPPQVTSRSRCPRRTASQLAASWIRARRSSGVGTKEPDSAVESGSSFERSSASRSWERWCMVDSLAGRAAEAPRMPDTLPTARPSKVACLPIRSEETAISGPGSSSTSPSRKSWGILFPRTTYDLVDESDPWQAPQEPASSVNLIYGA